MTIEERKPRFIRISFYRGTILFYKCDTVIVKGYFGTHASVWNSYETHCCTDITYRFVVSNRLDVCIEML